MQKANSSRDRLPAELGSCEHTWQMLTHSCTGYCPEPVRLVWKRATASDPSACASPGPTSPPRRRARMAMDVSPLRVMVSHLRDRPHHVRHGPAS
jgi:hypothetical protein